MQTTHTEKYTLGIDFGSLSGRAVLVRVTNGDIVAQATFDYPHAVMSETLPPLRGGWFHPPMESNSSSISSTCSDTMREMVSPSRRITPC